MNMPILHKNSTRPFELLRAKDLMTPNPVSICHISPLDVMRHLVD